MKTDKNAVMWFVIILAALLLLGLGLVYMARAAFWQRLFGEERAFLSALVLFFALLALLWWKLGAVNAVVCFLHLLTFWALCDIAAGIFGKRYYTAPAALLITFVWLVLAYKNAHTIRRTAYELTGDVSEPFRIVGFSDSHIGALFSGEELAEAVERMNRENADAAVIVGDFVDDDTSLTDMENACSALGKLQTKYGVYYVFGNHDEGYFADSKRGYGKKELTERLQANGVTVLEDETQLLSGNIVLCGRLDARCKQRLSAEELCAGQTGESYTVVLDHEPTDYAAESAAGVKLVLSGHTHGGQFLPIRKLIKVLGKNDLVYGHEKRGDTDFIVSSGIADWAIQFRTGCVSEYFVVDIH